MIAFIHWLAIALAAGSLVWALYDRDRLHAFLAAFLLVLALLP